MNLLIKGNEVYLARAGFKTLLQGPALAEGGVGKLSIISTSPSSSVLLHDFCAFPENRLSLLPSFNFFAEIGGWRRGTVRR